MAAPARSRESIRPSGPTCTGSTTITGTGDQRSTARATGPRWAEIGRRGCRRPTTSSDEAERLGEQALRRWGGRHHDLHRHLGAGGEELLEGPADLILAVPALLGRRLRVPGGVGPLRASPAVQDPHPRVGPVGRLHGRLDHQRRRSRVADTHGDDGYDARWRRSPPRRHRDHRRVRPGSYPVGDRAAAGAVLGAHPAVLEQDQAGMRALRDQGRHDGAVGQLGADVEVVVPQQVLQHRSGVGQHRPAAQVQLTVEHHHRVQARSDGHRRDDVDQVHAAASSACLLRGVLERGVAVRAVDGDEHLAWRHVPHGSPSPSRSTVAPAGVRAGGPLVPDRRDLCPAPAIGRLGTARRVPG